MKAKQKKILTIIAWTLFATFLIALPATIWWQNQVPSDPGLAVLGEVPLFQLTDQKGNLFTPENLKGRVWVADFIFTSCAFTCPALTQKMKQLKSRLGRENISDVGFLSFSVDPETDTPKRLAEYTQKNDIPYENWRFLTGDAKAIEKTVIEGFKIAVKKDVDSENPHIFDITHGNYFIVIDPNGQIRGYYDVMTDGLENLIQAIKVLKSGAGAIPTNPDAKPQRLTQVLP